MATLARASAAARDGDASFFAPLHEGDWARLVTATDDDGRSLLHSAVVGGSAELTGTLLRNGAPGCSCVTSARLARAPTPHARRRRRHGQPQRRGGLDAANDGCE